MSGIGQAANYDLQSQDLLAPSAIEESSFTIVSPFDDETSSFFDSLPVSKQLDLRENYQTVSKLIKKNKLEEAQAKLTELLKQFPSEPELHNLQALVKVRQKDNQAAIASFQQTLKLNPNNLNALEGMATLAIDKADLKKASDYIDRALNLDAKAVIFYVLKANIAFRQNNLKQVENILSTALNQVRGDFNLELRIVDNLIKLHGLKQQAAEILDLTQALADRYPNEKQALSHLAKAQIINRQFANGEQTLKKINSLDQRDINHRLLLARLKINRPEGSKEASQLIDEALSIEPDNVEALIHKTIYLLKENKYAPAMSLAEQVDKKFPASPVGSMLKADIYLAQKQLDKALEYNRRAYEIKPNARLLNQIGGLLAALGKTDEAVQLLESELDKNPQNLDAHFQVANLYLGQKKYGKAESHYQTILNEKPENVVILNNLAMIYHDQNNPKALELAKKAFALSPDSAAIADTYGIVLLQNGQPKDALAKLQKAADLAPNSPDIQFHLAKAQQANGNKQAAIDILQKIANASASFENKQAASDLLKELSGR